ncbi:MAG TPA: aspartate aminotransferase family protein [Candidatus Margulisiibacteriota bacterium]|nr:aspartate aminotransferase family protein [Candidatus Margulisiibacteriota bacterium]
MKIPQHGLSREQIFTTLEAYRANDMPWREGRTWAYVYDPGRAAEEVIKQAYMMYLTENALDPTVFPSLLRMENELVAMAASHLHGDANVVGNFTSGGTESIILAVKTARDYARAKRPQITAPEIVMPATAHAAFQKAAQYLCLEPVLVPVDPLSFKADVEAMRRAITPNTILLVGSAVSYAHGVVDPIGELGQLALEHDLLLHVDGCMGGFLLPYFRRLGAPVPDFDFSVPGVTSVSMDFHKYAFAAKGASVVLYRTKELRKYQIFTCANWSGYTMINPTVQSSKSGGPLAAAWAVLHFIGDDGYLEIARQVLDATRRIADGIERIAGLRLLGRPEMNLVAFTADNASVFHIIDEMKERGWYIQPQLGFQNSKENVHLSVNPASVQWVDALLADLRTCVEKAKALKSSDLAATIGATFGALDSAALNDETLGQMLGVAGVQGGALPARMAEINEILNALPPALRERVLTAFLNQLMQHKEGG